MISVKGKRIPYFSDVYAMDVVINSHVINSPLFQISIGLLLGEEGTILQGAWLIIFPTSIFSESREVQSESSTEFAGLPEIIESTFELKIHGERLDGSVDGLCFVTDENDDP